MHRRTFLRAVGVTVGALGTGGALAACGRGDGPASGGTISPGNATLNMINASFETLAGRGRRFAFGLTTAPENEPVKGADVDVYVTDFEGGILSGPFEATFYDEGGSPLGIYRTEVDVPDPGMVMVVAVADNDFGQAAVNVVDPVNSQLPVPGDEPIVTPTPTVDDDMGMQALCTRSPPCGMHDVSLDDALAAGRPVALLFATPAFCQTAVCAPAVSVLDEVRQSDDWGDTVFIHSEIYSDAGQTLAEPVVAWGLPTEPWLFTIGADGRIVHRLDGPMIRAELAALVEDLSSRDS
jgi:hypothetical protein